MSDECLLILGFFVISPVLVMKYRIQVIDMVLLKLLLNLLLDDRIKAYEETKIILLKKCFFQHLQNISNIFHS